MWRLQSLKVFINQRLTAAVEEVIGRLEKTITEYEEEMAHRHHRLLETALKPEEERQRAVFCADVQQQLVIKEEALSEQQQQQQQWSPSLDQEDPQCPHIKEEKEDFWTEEVSSQLTGLHEDHITKLPSTHVPVKSEEREKSQSSQLHQRQTEDCQETEPTASSSTGQVKTEPDGEDYGGPAPDRILVSDFKFESGSDGKTSHSFEASGDDWKEIRKAQTDLNTVKNTVPVSDTGRGTAVKSFSCSKCGKRFGQKHHLQTHMRCHTGEKPFSCSLCGKRFTQKGNLTQHLTVHTREKPCSCPVCGGKIFTERKSDTAHDSPHKRKAL